jgi:hypothetical protein
MKKELRYACLSESKAAHSHGMWTKGSSFILHVLQKGLLVNLINPYPANVEYMVSS